MRFNLARSFAVALLVLVTLKASGFVRSKLDESLAAYYDGLAACDKNDFATAIHCFSDAIRQNPKFADAYRLRADSYAWSKEYDKAIADCNDAIRLEPKNSDAYYDRGYAYVSSGRNKEAIVDFTEVIGLDPKNSNAFAERGYAHLSQGENKEAIADLSEAIRLDPKNSRVFGCRGSVYSSIGNNDKAIADFTAAIRLDPKNDDALGGRGYAHECQGDKKEAVADYSEELRLDPKNSQAFLNRGLFYARSGDDDNAIADLTKAIDLDSKNSVAYDGRGGAWTHKGDTKKAIADFNEAIRLNPKDSNAHYNRGGVRWSNGDIEKAIADYSEAIRLDPKSSTAFNSRAAAYAHKGENVKAIADYSDAIWLDATNSDFYYARAFLFEKIKDKTQAAADYNQVRRLRQESLLRELNFPSADHQPKEVVDALENRIAVQVKELKYDDKVFKDLIALTRPWGLIALSQKLANARRDFELRKLPQQQLVAEERYVAEVLARLIESAVMPANDSDEGYELSDVVCGKRAWCQGYTLLYFVLGNAVGLPVRGLHVTIMANGPEPDNQTHDACIVQLADGMTAMVDVTRNLGDRAIVSKSFRFDEVYQACGSYWKLKENSNPLGLHRVVLPSDASSLVAQLYDSRAYHTAELGDLEKAIAEASEAIHLDPKSFLAYGRRGHLYLNKGNFDRAIADCTESIRICPEYAAPYANRASANMSKGDFDKVTADCTTAVRLNPNDPGFFCLRASAFEYMGDYDKAIADYNEAIRLKPDDNDSYMRRGNAFALKDDFEKAIADYTGASRPKIAAASGEKYKAIQLIRPMDVIQVSLENPLPDMPLYGAYCLVGPDGVLDLGPYYGAALVAGMTCEQAKAEVDEYLRKLLRNPGASLRLVGRASFTNGRVPTNPFRFHCGDTMRIHVQNSLPNEPIDGDYLIAADGYVDLGKSYSKVLVQDLTLDEARSAIDACLKKIVLFPAASIHLSGWGCDYSASPPPGAAELVESYIREKRSIRLPNFEKLSDSETVTKLGLTEQQRRSLLQMTADEQIRQGFGAHWKNTAEMLKLPAEKRASHVAAFDKWCEERRADIAKQAKTILTPKQLKELESAQDDDPAPPTKNPHR